MHEIFEIVPDERARVLRCPSSRSSCWTHRTIFVWRVQRALCSFVRSGRWPRNDESPTQQTYKTASPETGQTEQVYWEIKVKCSCESKTWTQFCSLFFNQILTWFWPSWGCEGLSVGVKGKTCWSHGIKNHSERKKKIVSEYVWMRLSHNHINYSITSCFYTWNQPCNIRCNMYYT